MGALVVQQVKLQAFYRLQGLGLTSGGGRGEVVVQALVFVAAPLLLQELQGVSAGNLQEEASRLSLVKVVGVCAKESERGCGRTFGQLQSISKAKRRRTWDIPLTLGGCGLVGTRTQRSPDT